MSVNYHAFQNRGYLFSNHEADAEMWYEKYKNYDPARIAKILDLVFDEDYLYVPYYNVNYRLVRKTGRLEKETEEIPAKSDSFGLKEHSRYLTEPCLIETEPCLTETEPGETALCDGGWTDEIYFNEGMAVYHLLEYTKDDPRFAGIWVKSESLDGVVTRNPAVKDPLLVPFAERFTGRSDELRKACIRLGGREREKGDLCYEFDAFPWMPLRLEFWDADEDFPAQVNVMVDQYTTDYVHYETIGCIISDLLEKIERICRKN